MSANSAVMDAPQKVQRELETGQNHSPAATLHRRKPQTKKILLRIFAACTIGVATLVGVKYWAWAQHYETTDDAFVEGRVIPVASKVEGYVVRLNVDDNQHVNAGDVIAEIDPRDFQAAYNESSAALSAAKSRLADSEAQLAVFKAQVAEADADLSAMQAAADFSKQNADRYRALSEQATSVEDRQRTASEEATANAHVAGARSKILAAESHLAEGQTAVEVAQADVNSAQARLVQPQLNLEYTRIIAPQSGRIARRSVERGAYVKAGQSLLAIVSDEVWVTANFKETQLTNMRADQPVTLFLDTYPGREFKGHVDSLQPGSGGRFSLLPPENATGNYVKVVQRIPVKILFDFASGESVPFLAPGMSAEPEVKVR